MTLHIDRYLKAVRQTTHWCRSWITEAFYLSLIKKVVVKRPRFRSNNKTTITRVNLLKPLSFHLAKHRQKIFCFTSSLHIPKKQFYPDDGRFIIWPNAWSFYNNVSLKTNKMLPLFNFCIKVEPASACLRSFQQTGNLFRYIQLKNIKDLH